MAIAQQFGEAQLIRAPALDCNSGLEVLTIEETMSTSSSASPTNLRLAIHLNCFVRLKVHSNLLNRMSALRSKIRFASAPNKERN